MAGNEGAALKSRGSADRDFTLISLGNQKCSDTPGAISRYLGFRAIGIEQADANIGFITRIGEQPLHTVGTHAIVPVANTAGGCPGDSGAATNTAAKKKKIPAHTLSFIR